MCVANPTARLTSSPLVHLSATTFVSMEFCRAALRSLPLLAEQFQHSGWSSSMQPRTSKVRSVRAQGRAHALRPMASRYTTGPHGGYQVARFRLRRQLKEGLAAEWRSPPLNATCAAYWYMHESCVRGQAVHASRAFKDQEAHDPRDEGPQRELSGVDVAAGAAAL